MGRIQHCVTGVSFELGADTLVGSSSRCDLTLRHDSVSRNHASIWWSDGAWHVEDRNSKNGTWVDGARLSSVRRRLQVGAVLRFGARGIEEWRVTHVSPPVLPASAWATQTLPQSLHHATLLIRTDASLRVTVGTAMHQLEWRAPFSTLRALGRERLEDRSQGRSADQEGWLDRRVLAEMMCERDINQDICRIRQAFHKLEVFADPENVVEDLREYGKVRLGIYDVRVE